MIGPDQSIPERNDTPVARVFEGVGHADQVGVAEGCSDEGEPHGQPLDVAGGHRDAGISRYGCEG